MERNQKYLNELFQLLCEAYLHLKNKKIISKEKEHLIQGFMMAGRCFQVSIEEMETVIDEANIKVFGIDYKTRKDLYNRSAGKNKKVYDIPTFIRKKKDEISKRRI